MDIDIKILREFIKKLTWRNLDYVYGLGTKLGMFNQYSSVHHFLDRFCRKLSINERQKLITQMLNVLAKQEQQKQEEGEQEQGKEGEENQGEETEEEQYEGGGEPEDHQSKGMEQMQKILRHFFEKLADSPGYIRTPGRKNWDVRRLVKTKFNPIVINDAKHDREKIMEIYFILDSSGSMNDYARTFAGMLKGSRDLVKCYSGMEAHPNLGENGEKFSSEYNNSFATDLENWIKKVKPAPGSVLVFWGDTYGMNIRGEEMKVRKMLRTYKAYWLGTELQGSRSYSWEQDCLPEAGFRVIAPVKDANSLKEAIKKLR